jgi:hypothetical protein
MLYREIIAVCSEIHTKYINALWTKQNFWVLKLVVHILGFKSSTFPCLEYTMCQSINTTIYFIYIKIAFCQGPDKTLYMK